MKTSIRRLKAPFKQIIAFIFIFSAYNAHSDTFVSGLNALDRSHYASAYRSFKPLADKGVAEAQNNLGFLFQNGLGVRRNYNPALKWYQSAAIIEVMAWPRAIVSLDDGLIRLQRKD